MNYTHAERTELRHTVQDAINAAKVRLGEGVPYCANPITDRCLSADDKITLVQLNELADEIVAETWDR